VKKKEGEQSSKNRNLGPQNRRMTEVGGTENADPKKVGKKREGCQSETKKKENNNCIKPTIKRVPKGRGAKKQRKRQKAARKPTSKGGETEQFKSGGSIPKKQSSQRTKKTGRGCGKG